MRNSWLVLAIVGGLLSATPLLAQSATEAATGLGAQSLRPYWHVFVAYALAWVLILGWVVSIARRLARVEREDLG